MKGFNRKDQLFSLCGLNCGLCTMRLGGYCPGCGGGAGNQGCAIARCSLEHGGVEYCWQCAEYPCARYVGIDEYDSFITHRNQRTDMEKAQRIGLDAYREEQAGKCEILRVLLENYHDGRHKSLLATAVNLLELEELHTVLERLSKEPEDLHAKEKAGLAAALLRTAASRRGIDLKLRKKPGKAAK